MSEILQHALAWQSHGYSVLPVTDDGSKAPALRSWKPYQSVAAQPDQLGAWFANGSRHGLGLVCGQVSGQLEMFEFEGRAVAEGLVGSMASAMAEAGQADLWATLARGYVETTPSGGLHLYYRVQDGPARRNAKLAVRPATADELAADPDTKRKPLIETRGEGGYTVIAPTPGTHHPSGRPWVALVGSTATVPVITGEQRDTLYAVATLFDQTPATPGWTEEPGRPSSAPRGSGDLRPGDDYNERTDWSEILLPLGWVRVHPLGNGWAWRRPGKDRGISATTGQREEADRLYVFSTSTDFEPERPYDKYGAYTHLHFGGDFSASGKELRRRGYGSEPKMPTPKGSNVHPIRPGIETPTPAVTPATNGAAVLSAVVPPEVGGGPYPRHTDAGNAAALIDLHGDKLRFDADRGRWLVFTGHRWASQAPGGGLARELVKDTALHMPTGGDDKAARWQYHSLSAATVSSTLTSAQTDPRVAIHTNQLDADPYLLGTPGGIVDLRTGVLRDGRPADMVSRSTTVTPDFGPVPDIWTDYLATTFCQDSEFIAYMQRVFGVALIGEPLGEVLPFFYGPSSANGKSTLVDTAQYLLNTADDGYTTSIPAETLMVRKFEGHATELAVLAGRRLVIASELEEEQRLAEARVKLITGRDVISARFLFGQPFTFTPSHLIIMVGNEKPRVTIGGPALWRRLRCVPFNHHMPEEDRDGALRDKFRAIAGHLLAWMIDGARQVLAPGGGLGSCEVVDRETGKYEQEEDSVGLFVTEMVMPNSTGRERVSVVRAAYEKWCADNSAIPMSARRLTQQLAHRYGMESVKGDHGARFYTGLLLYAEEEQGTDGGSDDAQRRWPD